MTRTLLLLAALFVAAADTAALARDAGRSPESGETASAGDSLRGAWVIDSAEIMGRQLPRPGEHVIKFLAGGKVTMHNGTWNETGSYQIDDAKRPREIDLTMPRGGNPNGAETMKGLYEIEGDTLRIAFYLVRPGGGRPTSMDGQEVAVIVLKRKE
jgi:uncharacterized protein (TIGR03067 family)